MNSFYTDSEISQLGLRSFGKNVLLSKKASIYSAENITLGNNVRIDDFCILSGKVDIGDYVHIAAYSALYGSSEGIKIDDFANVSSRVAIYAVNDDYLGYGMTNPLIPARYKKIINGKVTIEKHVIIGSGCTILPNTHLHRGCAIGCMSLVKNDCDEFIIYAGIPAKKIKDRKKDFLALESQFLEEQAGHF